ncbi:right-handed parallel beta-helix repeat-containing protein [Bacillus solimangrovi]|uniref:Right handed beta helix domain-containing protein n=1 Tax=Bacillus solimangrovi TaxID=1305675 RepID=A0A1E5LAM1_9BACI|nr:right-handed parallel beta-helix repeat-containing protein [Bacillus solimangrovi]OEH91135.1 hypothetical protein BFG57_07120 [Bacillus solimangrovi]
MTIRVVPTEFATVQDAIDAAVAGDSIQILAGTFDGFEVTKERLKIFGCGIGKTIIAGTPAIISGEGVVVSADYAILLGFTVQGFQANGVEVNSNHNVLNSLESTLNTGASSDGFENNGQHNLIINCKASFNSVNGFEFPNNGQMNYLIRNESRQNLFRGFSFIGRNNCILHNATIDNTNSGFFLFGTLNTLFSNTSLKNQFGIRIEENSANIQAIENNVCNNINSGIIIESFVFPSSGFNVIDSNIVRNNGTDNTDAGILVENGTLANVIRFNKAKNNTDLDIEAQGGIGTNIYDGNKCKNSSPPNLCT